MNDSNTLLISGGRVYDHDGDVHQPAVADVLIQGSTITAVGDSVNAILATHQGKVDKIDATGKLLIPGFVNSHYHSYDVFSKGMFEEMPLDIWRQYTGRMGAHRSPDEVRLRTLLGAVECLRNGITTVQDMSILVPYDEKLVDVIVEAYEQVGIRTVLSISIRDLSDADSIPYIREMFPPDLQKAIGDRNAVASEVIAFAHAQIKRHKGKNGTLHWALSPSAPHRCTANLLQMITELAEQEDLPVYTHLYEAKGHALHARQAYGSDDGSLVRFMDRIGFLNKRLTVAHGLWTRRDELEMLAERGARVVINVMSNFKLKDGVPPINEFRRAGVGLALGCDCNSCSDVQNLFQSMKLCCLLAAAESPDPGHLTAAEAFHVATAGGAATANLGDSLGNIKPGMKADIALLDLRDPSFVPFNSAARQIVFSETGRSVDTVIVNGRVVMRDRNIITVDESELHRELADRMPGYRAEYEEMVKGSGPLRRAFAEQSRKVNEQDVGVDRFL
jgi:5-methylthioadenosine/S-adenosylhomocysteine deaminase